tara:strand:+ start:4552 stop:6330 length:1779 start_codon:yes stop_codon:yes gene_type:complete
MELYLVKSAVILTILYGFYKLVLENESMHVFKRFYLLGSLPAAFLIPLITFTSYVEVPVNSAPVFIGNSIPMPMPATEVSVNLWPFVIWGLYALGVVFFTIKFGKNLNQLISKIKNNPKFTRDSIHHILLKTPAIPHTFLNYVFLNKQKFEAKEIPDEVIAHEHVHAKQKHSIDILVVELLQIVFWFNPLLYFIKRSIKLNHEFLADRSVLNRGTDTAAYQNLLLAFSSHATTPSLANSINYSFIKKRFTVMKKQTSTQAIWLRSLLLLPLVALILYGFSTREVVALPQNNTMDTDKTIQAINFYIDQDSEIYLNEKTIAFHDISSEVNKLNTHLSIEEKQKYVRAEIAIENESDRDLATEIWKVLYTSNIWQMSISSLSSQRESGLKPPTNKMVGKTTKEAESLYQEMIKKGSNVKNAEKQTNNPWSINLSKSEITPEKENTAHQEKATKAEVEEYNKLAKKYNSMSKDNMRIISAEVDRMTVIYNKMTPKQKENGEPFPNFPPPPPAPPAPDAPDAPKVGKNPPLPPLPAPPPAPLSDPIEYIKALHKSGAIFFIGPHQYYYEEVLEMAKKTNDLNIDISQYPKVNLLGC